MPDHLSPLQRLKLIQLVNALPLTEFDELLFALKPKDGVVPPNVSAQGNRAKALLEWVEGPTGCGLITLQEVLNAIAPGKFTVVPSPSLQDVSVIPEREEDAEQFNQLVEQIRESCCQKIRSQYSQMRLLSGEEVEVDQLYVDVYLLDKPEYKHQISTKVLLDYFDINDDRLALGKRISRKPGFEVAHENPKLIILGKPGSGKTTFLKHLAVDWCNGKFCPSSIAVFVELRRISDEDWNLLNIIDQELGLDDWPRFSDLENKIGEFNDKALEKERLRMRIKNRIEEKNRLEFELDRIPWQTKERRKLKKQIKELEEEIENNKKKLEIRKEEFEDIDKQISVFEKQLKSLPLYLLLTQGSLLILLDGLDEVPRNSLRQSIQEQFHNASKKYYKNRFILTCRTQVMEVIPESFSSVEIAEFNLEQLKNFVLNWFRLRGESEVKIKERWKEFEFALDSNVELKELAVTPVILSLMCMVFQDEGQIISDRKWLYGRGIKLLLENWNEDKYIGDWEINGNRIYHKLEPQEKENLLSHIAAQKFENSNNFVLFEQEEIAQQIVDYLKLPNQIEGIAVLKAIEAQHGLLVERADSLWSFSHLTFQEYFAVQWLTKAPSDELPRKIEDKTWQKVIEQLVKSQQPANYLIKLIKKAIDQTVVANSIYQEFLHWILRKSRGKLKDVKPASIRAFYYASYYGIDIGLEDALYIISSIDKKYANQLASAQDMDLDRAIDLIKSRAFDLRIASDYDLTFARILVHNLACDIDIYLDKGLFLAVDLATNRPTPDRDICQVLDLVIGYADALPNALFHQLKELRNMLPEPDGFGFRQWWKDNREVWINRLQNIMIENNDIGQDWQFTEENKQQLRIYFESNKFLIYLMKIEGAVSDEVREEIENTLLLPWSEI